MKIKIEVKIHDDPEFCHSGMWLESCRALEVVPGDCRGDQAICNEFYDDCDEPEDLLHKKYGKWEKCDQCKEAYQKAKK